MRSTKRICSLVMVSILILVICASISMAKTLNVWTGYPELEPFYEWAGKEFAKTHPGVDVRVLSTSLREYEQKLVTSIPAGVGPDIFDISMMVGSRFIDAKLIPPNSAEIDAYLKSGAWHDFSVDYVTRDGKTYGVPLLNGSRAALYYNKDMFEEAGLDPNQPPETFAELMEYAKKLTKYDEKGAIVRSGLSLRITGGGSGLTEKFGFVLYNAGGDVIVPTADGKWKNGLDSEAGCRALQFYIDAIHKYRVDAPEVRHDAEAFVTEHTAMFLRESWVIEEIKSKNPSLNYGTAAMPGWVRRATLTQPWPIFLSAAGAKSKEAQEFLVFLTGRDAIMEFTHALAILPGQRMRSF
jgi:multiple sugar transport system substrate-binding protein